MFLNKYHKRTEDVNRNTHLIDNMFGLFYDSFFSKQPNKKFQKVLVGILSFIAILFLGRLTYLQLVHGTFYRNLALQNRRRYVQIRPERGIIYDSNDRVLVRNNPAFDVSIDTKYCKSPGKLKSYIDMRKCELLINDLGSLLHVDASFPLKSLKNNPSQVLVATGLSKDDTLPILAKYGTYPGVIVTVQPVRNYVFDNVFAHVLGYVGLDDTSLYPRFVGKEGIEFKYDSYLQGIPGSKIFETDATGKDMRLIAKEDSLPGRNIYTYLDLDVQQVAFNSLKRTVEEGVKDQPKPTGGAVVVMDPNTGGILALVSYPSFSPSALISGIDANEFNALLNDSRHPFYNRVLSGAYPPGSTFKMITASGVLEDNIISAYTTIFDPGYLTVNGYTFRNWKLSGHGNVDMFRALQVSNDTYFYTVGGKLGIERLAHYAKLFGLGDVTGIDLPGEVAGYMPDGTSRAWYLGDTFITSIGQGDVLATPLQMAVVTSYFANGGKIVIPQVVKRIDGLGDIAPRVKRTDIVSKSTYNIVRRGLELASSPGGTAYPLFDFPRRFGIRVAGKTGTSEFNNASGEISTHAWYTVFAPYENPNIVVTVFVESGGGGADVAVPIARDILEAWFSKKDVVSK